MNIGDRMKRYEEASRTVLPPRTPVILRIDGKAFHTYTRGCKRPFDERLSGVMVDTAKELCKQIQGAQFAYTQSDEISIFIHSYKKFDSSAWFDNQVQKITSVAASIAAATFTMNSWKIWVPETPTGSVAGYMKPAYFDARVASYPENEVCNYFIWRQQDATRNSIQMLARSLYSHKECDNKNTNELQEMCFQKGFNWNDLEVRWKRGIVIEHCLRETQLNGNSIIRGEWEPNLDIPVFTQDRQFIEKYLKCDEA